MKKVLYSSRVLSSFIAAIFIAGIATLAQAIIIGNLDYKILSEEDHTVDVAWAKQAASQSPVDSLFIPASVEIDGIRYSVTEIRERGFDYCDKINHFISIPGSVKKIGERAFNDLQYVDSIQLNEGLEFIGDDAFAGTMIKAMHLPESILEIGSSAWYGCKNLTNINWPDYITEIPNGCFRECSSLQQWDFSNITEIGFLTFMDCFSFENVVIPSGCYINLGGLCGYQSEKLTFEPGPTVLKSGALAGSKFHKLELPEGITLYHSVLDDCINLRTLIINQGTNLEDRAFWEQNAYGPPDDWRWKGENLFALDSVVYLASEPERMPGDIFTPNVYKKAVLYVKPEALGKAKYTIPWRRFKRIEAISSSIKDVLNDDPDDSNHSGPTQIFTLSGIPCGNNPQNLPPGTYIIRDKNGSRKFHITKFE